VSSNLNGYFAPVHIIGLACTPLLPEQDAVLDELAFDALSAALAECGLRKQDIGLSVQASMDILDGRSISSGLTNAAAGGYLSDSYRIEGDAGSAIIAAAQAVAAGDVEVAVAVAVYNPETTDSDSLQRSAFVDQLSALAFEPVFDRPVGMSARTAWALHASRLVDTGVVTVHELAQIAADQINRGASMARSARPVPVSVADVLASAPIAWPLHELMLPAYTTGAAAVILASPARAARARGRSSVLTGVGHATGNYTWAGDWLTDPGATSTRAAAAAYRLAGVAQPAAEVDVVEFSAATSALHRPILTALGLEGMSPGQVNASGGLASNYPGLLNGAVRLLEAIESLDRLGGHGRAAVHSTDAITGMVSEDVTVLVVEAA
jgi:acetyl-CoA acetyltransferase